MVFKLVLGFVVRPVAKVYCIVVRVFWLLAKMFWPLLGCS